VWSFRDVTLQRRAEAALRASEAHLRDLAIKRRPDRPVQPALRILEQLELAVVAHGATAGERLAVALLDVDYFKQINDSTAT
jgi:GGDEF domain-containing protein